MSRRQREEEGERERGGREGERERGREEGERADDEEVRKLLEHKCFNTLGPMLSAPIDRIRVGGMYTVHKNKKKQH